MSDIEFLESLLRTPRPTAEYNRLKQVIENMKRPF